MDAILINNVKDIFKLVVAINRPLVVGGVGVR